MTHANKLYGRIILGLLVLVSLMTLGACKSGKTLHDKLQDLEFTVVPEIDIPAEFAEMIAEKKQNPMKLSYNDQQGLYIAVGYGEQKTTGYSIGVDELYLAKNAVYIDTTLIGPDKAEKVTQTPTYPYVVVKLEVREEPIVFE